MPAVLLTGPRISDIEDNITALIRQEGGPLNPDDEGAAIDLTYRYLRSDRLDDFFGGFLCQREFPGMRLPNGEVVRSENEMATFVGMATQRNSGGQLRVMIRVLRLWVTSSFRDFPAVFSNYRGRGYPTNAAEVFQDLQAYDLETDSGPVQDTACFQDY